MADAASPGACYIVIKPAFVFFRQIEGDQSVVFSYGCSNG